MLIKTVLKKHQILKAFINNKENTISNKIQQGVIIHPTLEKRDERKKEKNVHPKQKQLTRCKIA
jgi:hypothetical protein